MAGIAFDAASNSGYQAASGSYNWLHTVGTGYNRILVVSVGLLNVANSVTTLTYNSVSLTKLRSDVSVSGTIRTEIWYLLNPASGANSIAITLASASVSGSNAASYSGVDQYTPVDAQNGDSQTTGAGGGSSSVTTTVVVEGAWIVDAIATTDTVITVGAGQNQRNNVTGAVGSSAQSDEGPDAAGAQTTGWDNIAALTSWTSSTFAMLPATVPGTTTSTSSTSTSSTSTSTSSTSTSTSSTSTSTSSTSTSTSSTSTSTSSTSKSTSTSSTSTSISSTSSSTSSTSTSSTSSSTSVSSTSSSISSTSLSSTSTSSTSSSTSVSSTSSSFSSTSSSISSTSASTSSTSTSTSSTSSSTSTTTLPPPFVDYTYEDRLTLPSGIITATSLLTAGSNVDATSFTTASINPTANTLILMWVYSIAAAAPNIPTATGNNLTWVQVATVSDGSALRQLTLFRAMSATPVQGIITIDFAGQTETGAAWSIVQYTGMDTTGVNGSGAIVQSVTNSTGGANATSLTVTLAAFSNANNATAGGFGIPLNTAGQPAIGSGFTATGQVNQASPNLSIGSEFLGLNDTTVDMNSGAASIPWAGIAVEIKNNIDLLNRFTSINYSNVMGDDGDYFIEYGSEYMIRNYQYDWTNNTDNISFTWRGRTTLSTLVSPMYIQIYNVTSAAWETMMVANKIPADVDFSVTVTKTTNVSNYYDSQNIVTFRAYQQVV